MAANIRNSLGVDLDSLFMARGSSTPRANVGIKVGSQDLADRYYASDFSVTGIDDRIGSNTGIKTGATDMRDCFRNISFAGAVPPSITTQPSSSTIVEGNNLTLTIVASGPGPLTYQWKKNGVNISGATGTSLSFTPIARADAATYTCAVTNAYGTTTSSGAVVNVQYAPSISSNPSFCAVMEGEQADFFVTAAAGNPAGITYQWQRQAAGTSGFTNISGGVYSGYTTNHLSFFTTNAMDGDEFRCVVSNSAGSSTSGSAFLNVDVIADPAVASSPNPITADAGSGPYALQCGIVPGSGTNYFTWKKNGVVVVGPRLGNIDATHDQHVFNPLTDGDAGTWRCTVTTSYGRSANSLNATVTVTHANPVITSQPSGISANDGDGPLALQCAASGGYGALSFAWYRNGSLVSGPRAGNISSTFDQHVFNPIGYGDAGTWLCRVTTPYGGQTDSNSVTVSVT